MLDAALQVGIGVVGVSALLLVSLGHRVGFLIGLCGQPLWLWFGIRERAWGVFTLSCCYTVSWAVGVYRHYHKGASRE